MNWRDYIQIHKRDKASLLIVTLVILCSVGVFALFGIKGQNSTTDSIVSQSTLDSISDNYTPMYAVKLTKGETICINTADTATLKRIPGIGSVYANRIVCLRDSIGRYTTTDQLREVKGIKGKLHAKIVEYITLEE